MFWNFRFCGYCFERILVGGWMINIHVDPILRITEQNQTELLMHGLKMLNTKYTFISIITKTTKICNKHFSPSLAQHGLCYKQKQQDFYCIPVFVVKQLKQAWGIKSYRFKSIEERFTCMIFSFIALTSTITNQCPSIVWHHVSVPSALVSFFHYLDILVELLPFFFANIT